MRGCAERWRSVADGRRAEQTRVREGWSELYIVALI